MARILFIAAHRLDRSPSQRFRFEQYLPWLEEEGFQWKLSPLLTEEEDAFFYRPGHTGAKARAILRHMAVRLRDVFRAQQFDVLFVQREAFFVGPAIFETLLARAGPPFIFDMDDAIWLPNVSGANRRFGWLKSPEKVNRILSMADLVVTGNAHLAAHSRRFNSRVRVIPTTIDTARHRPRPRDGTAEREGGSVVIGWTGSPTTIPHFHQALPVLRRLQERFCGNVHFRVIGDGSYRAPELGIRGIPWRPETEIQDLQEIDIGIMPLPETEWARGKCGLKALQYMALEIPAVLSDVGTNREIVTHGVDGFLCRSEEEWEEALTRLVRSPELRREMGRAGRRRVEKTYSVQANRGRYLKVLGEVLQE